MTLQRSADRWPEGEDIRDRRGMLLREACETLRLSSPRMVRAVSVTFRIDPLTREEAWWRALSQSLAAEYGFSPEVAANGTALTVRFARPVARQGRRAAQKMEERW